jgi:hypothetical protein
MITGSDTHPLIALVFLLSGGAIYFVYEVLRLFRSKKLPVLSHILDFAYAVTVFLMLILVANIFFQGQLKYFSIGCYFAGILLCRLTLKPPIRKFLHILNLRYKAVRARHTKSSQKHSD